MSPQRDVLDEVVKDHREIQALFARVNSATGKRKRDAFQNLVKKLAAHETAEQEVVHPLSEAAGATAVKEHRLAEEREAEQLLASLVALEMGSPEFHDLFQRLEAEVLAHAQSEESEEHPRIRAHVSVDDLRGLADSFRTAEAIAPTRPHPRGPTSAAGNLVMGPIISVADRARDAVRDATQPRASSPRPTRRRAASPRRTGPQRGRQRVVIDVQPDPKGGWRAQKRGAKRAVVRSDAKQEVVRRARDMARSQGGRLVIHRQDGRIQEERTYGRDPSRSRG
jgi:hemerythrin superfamily protein